MLSISTISESLNGKSIFYPTHHIPHKRLDPSIFLPNEISNMILSGSKDQATIEQIMTSHLAQGEFKSNVISYWKQCALTKCDNLSMLVLSHIKPWVLCGNDEKQDPFNGILLLPNIALAFESGFISFDANGSILISKEFTKNINYFDVDINSSLSHYEEQHQNYLEFHRNYIFRDTRVPTKMSYLYTPNILKWRNTDHPHWLVTSINVDDRNPVKKLAIICQTNFMATKAISAKPLVITMI